MKAFPVILAGALISAGAEAGAQPPAFSPPQERSIPDGELGQLIREGEDIFLHTRARAPAYVGNDLDCVNCHLDAGRQPGAGPLWAAYVAYPAYRRKTDHVDSYAERLQGCFEYSMNGHAPPLGDRVLAALDAYSFWLSRGAPVGEELPGRGYARLAAPAAAPSFARGREIYARACALCHGASGEGQRNAAGVVFPPLWGARSFNWGAGMHEYPNAAAFIKANMPLGLGGSLSDQDAWDVAYFMDAHERPQDPRYTQSIAETRRRFHDTPGSLYGQTVDGVLLGEGTAK